MEPFYVTEVDQIHNLYCGCWECAGRSPDKRWALEDFIIGKCRYCLDPIIAAEGLEAFHYVCREAEERESWSEVEFKSH